MIHLWGNRLTREAVSISAMQQFLDQRCNLASMKHFLTKASHIFHDFLGLLWPEVLTSECFRLLATIGVTLGGNVLLGRQHQQLRGVVLDVTLYIVFSRATLM